MHDTKTKKTLCFSDCSSIKRPSQSVILLILIAYTVILICLSLLRITDNAIWGDEGYTIALSKMTFEDMLLATAADVHPPLYYIIVQLICGIFGFSIISYRIASVIPYILLMLFSLTTVRRKWGNIPAVLFISFASWLGSSIAYNLEIRMYSWAAFFVLVSYVFLYDILTENKTYAYVGFVLSSLCAAYTHYYALISVAFFYAALMIAALIQNKKYMHKTLLTWGITIVAYLPWFFVLVASYIRSSEDFWLDSCPSFMECLLFLFDGYTDACIFLLCFLIVLAAYFLRCYLIHRPKIESTECSAHVRILHVNHECFWVLAGILGILGTIITGITISKLVRPMFLTRYLYPVATVAWLLFGITCSKLKRRHLYASAVLLFLIAGGAKRYQVNVRNEIMMNASLQKTLEATADISAQDSVILTDVNHIAWTLSQYYYPDVPVILVNNADDFLQAYPQEKTWFICSNALSAEYICGLKEIGINLQAIIENEFLGERYISIYRLHHLTEPAETVH